MPIEPRKFGEPPSLKSLIENGRELFDVILEPGIRDRILAKSAHVGQIAINAAQLAAEVTQKEGDGDAKRLVRAAYSNLSDVAIVASQHFPLEKALTILKSDQTHKTLLDAAKEIESSALERMTHEFRTQGAWLEFDEDGLRLQEGIVIPHEFLAKNRCPYALGDKRLAAYFTLCTDEIFDTYIDAFDQDMPKNTWQRATRVFALMRERSLGDPETIIK